MLPSSLHLAAVYSKRENKNNPLLERRPGLFQITQVCFGITRWLFVTTCLSVCLPSPSTGLYGEMILSVWRFNTGQLFGEKTTTKKQGGGGETAIGRVAAFTVIWETVNRYDLTNAPAVVSNWSRNVVNWLLPCWLWWWHFPRTRGFGGKVERIIPGLCFFFFFPFLFC